MIVKSLTRKTASFLQLLHYFTKSEAEGTPRLTHNLTSRPQAIGRIYEEFMNNSRCMKRRKGGIVLYHEILSLAEGDREQITPEILLDLGRKFLELRAPQALAFGCVHLNTGSPHLHLLISANLLESPKKLRVSKKRFGEIKRELETYQRERYPHLIHSIALTGKKPKKRQSREERELNRRAKQEGKASRKEAVREAILDCFEASTSLEECVARLREKGFGTYMRGKTPGVIDLKTGEKYRLKTLGLEQTFQQVLQVYRQMEIRKEELRRLEIEMALKREREERSR